MFARFVTVLFTLFFMGELPHEAHALVGNLDTENKFPYVVLVEGKNALGSFSCSGVAVSKRVVLTAAHCLWRYGRFASNVTVSYEQEGAIKTLDASAKQVSESYVNMARSDVAADSTPVSLPQTSASERSPVDIGVITVQGDIVLPEYVLPVFNEAASKSLAAISGGKATVVGFGLFRCDSYRRHAGCEFDAQRRHGRISVTTVNINGLKSYRSGSFPLIGKVNPVMEGDSGGGLFIEAAGQTVLIGIISSRGYRQANYAPLWGMRSFLKPFLKGR